MFEECHKSHHRYNAEMEENNKWTIISLKAGDGNPKSMENEIGKKEF